MFVIAVFLAPFLFPFPKLCIGSLSSIGFAFPCRGKMLQFQLLGGLGLVSSRNLVADMLGLGLSMHQLKPDT